MKILRRFRKKAFRDKFKNVDVRRTCNIDNINELKKKKNKSWNGIPALENEKKVKI